MSVEVIVSCPICDDDLICKCCTIEKRIKKQKKDLKNET